MDEPQRDQRGAALRVTEQAIIDYYEGTLFNGRWILPSGERVCPYWQDHRSINGVDGIEDMTDAIVNHDLVSIHGAGEVSIRYAGWRPTSGQMETLRPILEAATDLYVEHTLEGETESYSAPHDLPVSRLALMILDPVAYRCKVAYDDEGYW